jgi:hypothetical protein
MSEDDTYILQIRRICLIVSTKQRTRHLKATNPLDKVYALLNLVKVAGSQEPPNQVATDYTAVPSEVYCSIANMALRVLPVPGVLPMVYNLSLPQPDGLPSYVPDFETTIPALTKPSGLEVGSKSTCQWSPYKATGGLLNAAMGQHETVPEVLAESIWLNKCASCVH